MILVGILLDFIFFSIIGYVGELIYCSLNKRKSGKALYGPWCPLYGLGGLLITSVLSSFESNILLVYIVGVIVSSFTEYFVSLVLEVIFDARWWDYSFKKFNLNGRICLENSLLFGVLAVVVYYLYIPFRVYIVSTCNLLLLRVIVYSLSLAMSIDGLITILEAMEVKYRLDLIDEEGIGNKVKLKNKLNHLKSDFNYKRLINEFDFDNREKSKFLKSFYSIKDKMSKNRK